MIEAYFASLRDLSFEVKSTIEKGVYSGSVAYSCQKGRGGGVSYAGMEGKILGGLQMFKVGVYFGSEGGFCECRI